MLLIILCLVIGCTIIFISGCATTDPRKTVDPTKITTDEVKIKTGRKDITVKLEIYEPKYLQTAKGIILMFGGTGGSIKPSNFHVREIDRFVELGYIAVLQDKPSNFWNQPFEFRWSKEHQADITKVISYLKDRYNKKSLFLLGYSEGVWSPAPYHLFHYDTSDVSGIILMGGIYLNAIQSGQINLFIKMPYPVLIVKHEDDRAPDGGGSGFSSNTQYYEMLEARGRKDLFIVKGGIAAGSIGPLDPYGPHGFGGKEKEVVKAVVEWMDGTNGMDAKEVKRIIK